MSRAREVVLILGAVVLVSGIGGYDVRLAAIATGLLMAGGALAGMIKAGREAKDAG